MNYDELPKRGKELSTGEKLRECNNCGERCYMFYEENRKYKVECEECGEVHWFEANSLDNAMKQWNELIILQEDCEHCPLSWEERTYEGECIACGCHVNEDTEWCKKSFNQRLKKSMEIEN